MDQGQTSRLLTLGWIVGLALCVLASSLSAANGRPPERFLPVGFSGAVFVTSGYLVARRRPGNSIGYLLAVAGLSTVAYVVLRYLFPFLQFANGGFGGVGAVALALALLAFPSGHLPGRVERVAIGIAIAAVAGNVVIDTLAFEPMIHDPRSCPPCEPNRLRLADPSVYPVAVGVGLVAIAAAGLLVSFAAARRWVIARGAARRVLAPVLFGGVVTALGLALTSLVLLTGVDLPLAGQVDLTLRLLIPIGLAITFLRVYAARGAIARAVVQLGVSPSSEGLEDALRRTLGDPNLQVVRWSPASESYLDREGLPVAVPPLVPGQTATLLEQEGRSLGAVLHDRALEVDPSLIASMSDAVRFTMDATSVREELRARGGAVAALPRGEVTFLFGDLERSTELLTAIGDRYVDLLAELRGIVRDIARALDGHVVDMRADECFLVFTDAATAAEAALRIQQRMGNAAWPEGVTPRLRIGLHTGRPELTADGYVGLDVHVAARVMATASGGETYLSATTVAAVGDRLPRSVSLDDLGHVTLRGIDAPEHLYALAAARHPT